MRDDVLVREAPDEPVRDDVLVREAPDELVRDELLMREVLDEPVRDEACVVVRNELVSSVYFEIPDEAALSCLALPVCSCL